MVTYGNLLCRHTHTHTKRQCSLYIKAENRILCPCVHLKKSSVPFEIPVEPLDLPPGKPQRLGEGRRAFLLQRPPTSWNFATWQFQNMSWKVCQKTNGGAKLTKLAQVVEITHKESRVDQNN